MHRHKRWLQGDLQRKFLEKAASGVVKPPAGPGNGASRGV